jgi:hypothetical protein
LDRQKVAVSANMRDKAKFQAFVASRSKPQMSLKVLLGETEELRYGHSAYDRLAAFLTSL